MGSSQVDDAVRNVRARVQKRAIWEQEEKRIVDAIMKLRGQKVLIEDAELKLMQELEAHRGKKED